MVIWTMLALRVTKVWTDFTGDSIVLNTRLNFMDSDFFLESVDFNDNGNDDSDVENEDTIDSEEEEVEEND
jgi:hypothetical protein